MQPSWNRLLALAAFARQLQSPSGIRDREILSTPLVGNLNVQRFKLKNGLKILVVEDHSAPTFAYQTWFHVGSKDEEVGKTGLAHLFEHMMFKGTKNHKDGEYDRILEGAGAEGENAFTSRDYTAYVQELPKGNLELIAQMESDRMVNLIVDEKAFRTELEVVQNERRFRNENSADGMMYQEIFGLAFDKHPYHWPVIGYQKDLDSMHAPDGYKFYREHYSPNRATIIVVGDVTAAEVLKVVDRYYAALPPTAPEISAPRTPEPEQTAPKLRRMPFSIQVEKLMVGYRVPEIFNEERAALDVLQVIMAGGKSSRLYRAAVKSGVASEIEAFDLEDEDPSLFLVAGNLQKGKKATQLETIMLKEFERVGKEGVTADELERARNRIDFQYNERLSTHMERASFLGHFETSAGGFEVGVRRHDQAQKVESKQIQQLVTKYFKPHQRVTMIGEKK